MAERVRICPRCGRTNPEYENVCTGCDQFIGMEPATAAPPTPAADPEPDPKPAARQAAAEAPPAQATRRWQPRSEGLYLRLADTGLTLTAGPGDVLGQAHPASDAALQVPSTVDGSAYLHRRHCRFLQEQGRWLVLALDQAEFGSDFTNPTFVNGQRLAPGERRPLADRDQLRLSGLTFELRIP